MKDILQAGVLEHVECSTVMIASMIHDLIGTAGADTLAKGSSH